MRISRTIVISFVLFLIPSLLLGLGPQGIGGKAGIGGQAGFGGGSGNGGAPIALVAHGTGNAVSPATTATTPALNMTGATLLVIDCNSPNATITFTASDSSSNTWQAGIIQQAAADSNQLFYAFNPTVSASQTFSCSSGLASSSVYVEGFKNTLTTSAVFDKQTHANSATPGSITPAVSSEVFVTGVSSDTTAPGGVSINSSFIVTDSTTNSTFEVGGMAYFISTGTAAENPTWTNATTDTNNNSTMMAFEP